MKAPNPQFENAVFGGSRNTSVNGNSDGGWVTGLELSLSGPSDKTQGGWLLYHVRVPYANVLKDGQENQEVAGFGQGQVYGVGASFWLSQRVAAGMQIPQNDNRGDNGKRGKWVLPLIPADVSNMDIILAHPPTDAIQKTSGVIKIYVSAQYVDGLGPNAIVNGKDGWRLPTQAETNVFGVTRMINSQPGWTPQMQWKNASVSAEENFDIEIRWDVGKSPIVTVNQFINNAQVALKSLPLMP